MKRVVAWLESVQRMIRSLLPGALIVGACGLLAACGGSSRAISIIGVTTPQLVSIAVGPANTTLNIGRTQQFIATGTYSDGSSVIITSSVTWTSIVTTVATVSNGVGSAGIATALATGSTTVTATLGPLSGHALLTVAGSQLKSILVTPATASIASGAQLQYTATGVYADNSTQDLTRSVTWGVEPLGYATVSNTAGSVGLVTATRPDEATITATFGGVTGAASLTITPITLVTIAVTPANTSLPKGTTLAFTATGTFSDGHTQNLTTLATWTTSNPTVATVNATGTLSALSQGSVSLTATYSGVPGATTVTIGAPTLVSIAVTPANDVIGVSNTLQYIATGTYTDNSTQVLTNNATWKSGTPTTATIGTPANAGTTPGLATGEAIGTTTISATLGTVTSPGVLLTVSNTLVFVANYLNDANGNGSVLQYTINGAGQNPGALTANGNPPSATAGLDSFSLAADPSAHYLYVANYSYAQPNEPNGSVSEYAIAADGTLTQIGSVPTLQGPNGITIHPSGKYAYVADYDGHSISQYDISAPGTTAGTLTPMTNPSVSAADGFGTGNPANIALNPAGTFAYVADYNTNGTIYQYSISPTDGSLSKVATVQAGSHPNGIVVDHSGSYLYLVNSFDNNVSAYTIDPNSGVLNQIGMPVATGPNPRSIVVDTNTKNAYVTNRNNGALGSVGHYNIVAGILSLERNYTVQNGPEDLAIDPTGTYLYVSNRYSGTISEFTINADGTLTPLTPPSVTPTAANPTGIIAVR